MQQYDKALSVMRKEYGPDHAHVAATLNNMASTLDDLGRINEAMEKYKEALRIKLQALGPDHPDVATTYFNMSFIAQKQGKLPEAIQLIEQAHGTFVKRLGEAHDYTKRAAGALAQARARLHSGTAPAPEDAAAINRLAALGFDKDGAARAYAACGGNEMMAANMLMDVFGEGEGEA